MNKLTKLLLPVIALVVIVITIPPFIIGYFVEKDMLSIQNKVPSNSGIKLQVQNYHRGWFKSTAQLVMNFTSSNQEPSKDSPSILFDNTVYHGPFIFAHKPNNGGSTFAIAKAYVVSTVSDPAKIPLTIEAKVGFADKVNALATSDKIVYELQGENLGSSFVLQGINLQQTSSAKFTHVQTNFALAAFELLDKDQGHLKIKDIRHESDFNEKKNNYWIGNGTTSIAAMEIQTAKNAHLELQNFRLEQKSQENDGRGFGQMTATIEAVKWDDQDYGKQIIEISARNFDTQSLKEFTDAIGESQSQNLALLPFGKPFRTLLTFLGKGIEFSLDRFDVNTTWGRINADAKFLMPQSETALGSIQEAYEKFTAAANITLPEPVAVNLLLGYLIQSTPQDQQATINPQAAQAQLQSYVDNGWVEKTTDNLYKISIKVEKAQLYLNNKLFEMPAAKATTAVNDKKPTKTTLAHVRKPKKV